MGQDGLNIRAFFSPQEMARRRRLGESVIKQISQKSGTEELANKIGEKLEAQRTPHPVDKVEEDTNSDKLENEEDLDSNQKFPYTPSNTPL